MAERPEYQIQLKEKNYEIRRYAGYIQAEVIVKDSTYRSALQSGFSILADYIFGNNKSRQKVEMTSPVIAQQAEKIAMTTPVTVRADEHFVVAFIMPSAYTMATLPLPNNLAVHIREVSSNFIAAVRFNGYFNSDSIEQHKTLLMDWLQRNGYSSQGSFRVAGYNPPWVPSFLARNEVWIEVLNITKGLRQ